MRAYHDTRNLTYRAPYGAVAINTPVSLSLDVWDAPGASVKLRIWLDGAGEVLHDMTPISGGEGEGQGDGQPNGAQRFQVTFAPDSACTYWYQFIIDDEHGTSCRYGALDGKTGGEGRLLGWEPPSFQLNVFDPQTLANGTPIQGLCYSAPTSFFEGAQTDLNDSADGQVGRIDAAYGEGGPHDGQGAAEGDNGDAGKSPESPAACEKLDYLQGIGVTCVLLEQERMQEPSRGCDPDMARVDELRGEARARGIEIIAGDDAEERLAIMRPAMDALVSFVRGGATAYNLVDVIESLHESTPAPTMRDALSMLGGNGQTRLANLFGNAPAPEEMSPEQRAAFRLDDGQKGLAKGRLWCASLVQMMLPPTPAVRYGDEVGMQGYAGAGADGDFPWQHADDDCRAIIRNAYELRRSMALFETGDAEVFAANEDVVGIWRHGDGGDAACILVNRSLANEHDVFVPMVSDHVSEVIAGYGLPILDEREARSCGCDVDALTRRFPSVERFARVHLHQLGSAVLYFHDEQRLERPMESGVGVLAHITSVPGAAPRNVPGAAPRNVPGAAPRKQAGSKAAAPEEHPDSMAAAPGTLGAPARAFVDWLAEAGVRYWQVLPVNPTDEHGSPYAGISAFAGNVRLLEGGEPEGAPAADALKDAAFKEFCERESAWLEPYACFMAIRQKQGAKRTWQEWPKKWRTYDPSLVAKDKKLAGLAQEWRYRQFLFERQWDELRSYANDHGVSIIGDMPIYVSPDSADVWAHPEIFKLDDDGRPAMVAGCPPDAFAEEGQIWGNPVYDWNALKSTGYDWWLRRLERAFELYDLVRLDHFIGFSRYFSIPNGQKAIDGTFHPGPGTDFFIAAHDKFGALPVIAEDLGYITPAVRALGAACGFPGMDIAQFVDGGDPLSGYWPRPEKIAYSGTHDNQTIVGYAQERYGWLDTRETAAKLLENVASSTADVCVFPLQDVMLLDNAARMNTPGTTEHNWVWQADEADMADALERTKALVELHARTR